MGQEKGPLIHTEEATSSPEYEPETESSAGSVFLAQQSLLPTPSPFTLILILSPLLPYTISQSNYSAIIR